MAQVLDTSSPATATSDTHGGGEKEREEEGERRGGGVGRRKKEREEGREKRVFHNYSLTDERVTSFRFRVWKNTVQTQHNHRTQSTRTPVR